MKKILFAVCAFFAVATFASAAEAPKLPDNIAQWSKVVDSTCDVKEGIILHNVGYALLTTETDTMHTILVYEKNNKMVFFTEGLIVKQKVMKVSTSILGSQGDWIMLDKTDANQESLALSALGVTKEEFMSCRTRQKHQ